VPVVEKLEGNKMKGRIDWSSAVAAVINQKCYYIYAQTTAAAPLLEVDSFLPPRLIVLMNCYHKFSLVFAASAN